MNIDMKKYMTFTCEWKKNLGLDSDTRMSKYGEGIEIKCYKYGKNIYMRDNLSGGYINAMVYLLLEEVKVGDIIDGQSVKSVNSYPENWDGVNQLYEVLTWET